MRGEGERGEGRVERGAGGGVKTGVGLEVGKHDNTLCDCSSPHSMAVFARQRDEVGLHRHPVQIVGHHLCTGISS